MTRQLYPREGTLVPIEFETGWASESAWTFLRKETSFVPYRDSTPYGAARSIVTVLATLYLKKNH